MDQQARRPEPRETALGYELDTITLRDIAAVRYVHHHEWLDHVLGSSIPTSRIEPPRVLPNASQEELNATLQKLDAELNALKKEEKEGWKVLETSEKDDVLANAITRLREDYGKQVPDELAKEVERVLGRTIVPAEKVKSVPITYNRAAEEAAALNAGDGMDMME